MGSFAEFFRKNSDTGITHLPALTLNVEKQSAAPSKGAALCKIFFRKGKSQMSKEKIRNPLAQFYHSGQTSQTLPEPIDTLKREDYPSRAAWLEACADLAMKRNTPEFKKAFYDMERKANRRDFEAAQAKLQEESRKMISSVKLSEREVRELDERAAAEIMEKVKRGELPAAEMANASISLSAKMQLQAREEKVRREVFNAALREAYGPEQLPQDETGPQPGAAPGPNTELKAARGVPISQEALGTEPCQSGAAAEP